MQRAEHGELKQHLGDGHQRYIGDDDEMIFTLDPVSTNTLIGVFAICTVTRGTFLLTLHTLAITLGSAASPIMQPSSLSMAG